MVSLGEVWKSFLREYLWGYDGRGIREFEGGGAEVGIAYNEDSEKRVIASPLLSAIHVTGGFLEVDFISVSILSVKY